MAIKILLIDDDSDDRALFREALEEVSPETICVTEADPKKALKDLLDLSAQLPTVIFVDINMPRISGWDCLNELKANSTTKEIPIVMYSTSSHERDVEKASTLGAACLLTKPEDFCQLKKCLTDVIKFLNDNTPLIFLQLQTTGGGEER
ncbi:MAG TPA: response regulator [Chryseolinea sp.]|nr:response regulator [Chryseolinea sp.]